MVTVDHEALADALQALWVARLWVFGSTARGDAGPGSDIDLLYEVAPERTWAGNLSISSTNSPSSLVGPSISSPDDRHPLCEAVLSEAK